MHSFHQQENKLRGYFLHRREYKFSFTCTENEKVDRLWFLINSLNLINLTSNRYSDENVLQTLGWGVWG